MKHTRFIALFVFVPILLGIACGSSGNVNTQDQDAQNTGAQSEGVASNDTQQESAIDAPAAEAEPVVEESATPKPTSTPEPTPNPNMISSGTYLVGTDIQPGLYRGNAGSGFFGSCYWERLSGLSGQFDDIIANDGPNGQFYVEVFETDMAFSVDCEVEYLETMPEPQAEFPTVLAEGAYLVGIDIAPGLYRGEAGLDLMDSCYWERLSGFSGDFDDLVSNDGPNGQFYVQVSDTDKGFSTNCEVEYLPTLPNPLAEFPTVIPPGTYLVGIDIAPGTYRGQAGEDVLESCYWERLSGVSGGFNDILANDGPNGQYYIQVGGSDFALRTSCELELTGN